MKRNSPKKNKPPKLNKSTMPKKPAPSSNPNTAAVVFDEQTTQNPTFPDNDHFPDSRIEGQPHDPIYLVKKTTNRKKAILQKEKFDLDDNRENSRSMAMLMGVEEKDTDEEIASDESDIEDELARERDKQAKRRNLPPHKNIKHQEEKNNEPESDFERNAYDDDIGESKMVELAVIKQKVRDATRDYLKNRDYAKNKLVLWCSKTARWWCDLKFLSFIDYINPFQIVVSRSERNFGTGISSFFNFWRTMLCLNLMITLIVMIFLWIPWLIFVRDYAAFIDWKMLLGLLGITTETINRTFLYYGGYPAATQSGEIIQDYFGLLFSVVILLIFLISAFILIINIGKHLRRVTDQDPSMKYSQVILSMWDLSVTKKKSVREMQTAIGSRLKEMTKLEKLKKKNKGCGRACNICCRRSIGWFFSFVLMLLAPIIVIAVNTYYEYLNTYFPFLTAFVNTSINIVFPLILRFLVAFENYRDAKVASWNEIFRVYFIKMVTTIATVIRVNTSTSTTCTTNEAGLVFYQLIWIDFVTTALNIVFMNFFLRCISFRRIEFSVSMSAVQLFYTQSLIWIGTLHNTSIPLIGLCSSLFLFFLKYFMMQCTMKFPDNPMAQARPTAFYSIMLFTLYLTQVPILFFFTTLKSCGPFTKATAYESFINFFEKQIFELFTKWTGYSVPYEDWFTGVRDFLAHPMVLFVVIIIVFNLLYFSISMMLKYRNKVLRFKRKNI